MTVLHTAGFAETPARNYFPSRLITGVSPGSKFIGRLHSTTTAFTTAPLSVSELMAADRRDGSVEQ